MDVTISVPEVTVWWRCGDCGVDIALPAAGTDGFLVPCPDCDEPLEELWRWDTVARPPAVAGPVRQESVAA